MATMDPFVGKQTEDWPLSWKWSGWGANKFRGSLRDLLFCSLGRLLFLAVRMLGHLVDIKYTQFYEEEMQARENSCTPRNHVENCIESSWGYADSTHGYSSQKKSRELHSWEVIRTIPLCPQYPIYWWFWEFAWRLTFSNWTRIRNRNFPNFSENLLWHSVKRLTYLWTVCSWTLTLPWSLRVPLVGLNSETWSSLKAYTIGFVIATTSKLNVADR